MAIARGTKTYTQEVEYEVPDEFIDDPQGAHRYLYDQSVFPSPTWEGDMEYDDFSFDVDEVTEE